MRRLSWSLPLVACTVALAVACTTQAPNPSTPSAADPAAADANADGSTLKATAPTPQSPANGVRLSQGQVVTLVVANSTTLYTGAVALSYRFEVTNTAGTVIENALVASGAGSTSRTVAAQLEGEQTYQWRARAEFQGIAGPWSARQSFGAPPNDGYVRGNELYDPLFNGKTIGQTHGSVTFIPGVGIRLNTVTSFVSYELQQPLTAGEISMLVTNIVPGSDGGKSKLFSMSDGYDDMTTNRRRFTVEKRGTTEPGDIAWRIIASQGAIETIGAERRNVAFSPANTYFWRATWDSDFRLIINEGGVSGRNVYDFRRGLLGVYNPNHHVVFLGSPDNRSGPQNQSVPGVVIRQVWVSRNARPSFANQ